MITSYKSLLWVTIKIFQWYSGHFTLNWWSERHAPQKIILLNSFWSQTSVLPFVGLHDQTVSGCDSTKEGSSLLHCWEKAPHQSGEVWPGVTESACYLIFRVKCSVSAEWFGLLPACNSEQAWAQIQNLHSALSAHNLPTPPQGFRCLSYMIPMSDWI